MIDYAICDKPLKGKKVLINAGPTQEAIDPVRYITNHSSGLMGYSLARAAFCLGADVTLVSGPTHLKKPYGVEFKSIISAEDMYNTIVPIANQYDYIILSAAIADYTIPNVSDEKIKKSGDDLSLELSRTKDILKTIGEIKTDHQILCGFAMETQDLIENATKKLINKNADMIVANSLKVEGAGFKGDTNVVSMMVGHSP